MGETEIPPERFSRSQIQERIDGMWKLLFPREHPDTWMYPVKRIAEELVLRGWIEIITNQTLPLTQSGEKIWGKFSRNSDEHPRYTIYIDRSLQGLEKRSTATLAHEIGHFVLHRKLLKGGTILSTQPFFPNDYQARRFGEKAFYSEREWVEWHANEFMGALLLPKDGLQARVIQIQKDLGILNRGQIRFDHQPCNQIDAGRIIAQIASETMIQQPLVESRLRHCGILKEHRSAKLPSAGMSILNILAAASLRGEKISDFPFPSQPLKPILQRQEDSDEDTRELWFSDHSPRKNLPSIKVS